jgi:hypothetical protein
MAGDLAAREADDRLSCICSAAGLLSVNRVLPPAGEFLANWV